MVKRPCYGLYMEMERDCIEHNTLLTLSNGLSMKIKNMKNNNINVYGFDENKNGLTKSKQVGFLDKGKKDCIELTMEDGRKITCTEDHPLLTQENKWIKAKDLTINEDKLKVGVTCPELDIEKEITDLNNDIDETERSCNCLDNYIDEL